MKTQEIKTVIEDLINKIGLTLKEIVVDEDKNKNNAGSVWFRVYLEEPHFFVAKNAENLSALNHLVKRIFENKQKEQDYNHNVIIDINNYQKNKIDALHAIAHMMAERARYFKSNIEVDRMGAFERRIVHEFLSDLSDIKTESIGEGQDRRVIVKYVGGI